MIKLEIIHEQQTLAKEEGTESLHLFYEATYEEGTQIKLSCDKLPAYLMIQLDDAIGESLVYLTGTMTFDIPFGEKKICYAPKSFAGNSHLLSARLAYSWEIEAYRNLAFNPYDTHTNTNCYPHASANVETRGESVFAARNAIDGNTANHSHGNWPYESWGINKDPNAAMHLDFGRTIRTDRILLTTRADFPHDAWWEQVTFTFSDGSQIDFPLVKTDKPQCANFSPRTITGLTVEKLIKAEDPSPFPALSQIEVYGTEV